MKDSCDMVSIQKNNNKDTTKLTLDVTEFRSDDILDDVDSTAPCQQLQQQRLKQKRCMELNDAYESLEKMRRLNLELACQERGIYHNVDYEGCTSCLFERGGKGGRKMVRWFPRNNKTKKSAISLRPNQKPIILQQFAEERQNKRKPLRCLTCGAPCCWKHSSSLFRQQKQQQQQQGEIIHVCQECEQIFRMDFIIDCMTLEQKARREKLDRMIDLYDRARLLLLFSAQFLDDIIIPGLENKTKCRNKMHLGGSSVGMVSGALGVAAFANILTPAGTPLLIASLLLGTGATALQAGTEIRSRFFDDTTKVADRILATHGMLRSILIVTQTLQKVATHDQICMGDALLEEISPVLEELQNKKDFFRSNEKPVLWPGRISGRFPLVGVEGGTTIAQSSRILAQSSVTTTALSTLRLARMAGTALAAATILIEARSIHKTLRIIRAGSPCEKAEALRRVQDDLQNHLPTTEVLDQDCQGYLDYMDNRGRRILQEEAVRMLLQVSISDDTVDDSSNPEEEEEEEEEIVIMEDDGVSSKSLFTDTQTKSSSSTSSLFHRIQSQKQDSNGLSELHHHTSKDKVGDSGHTKDRGK